jgi:hypothetical protein
MNEQHTTVGDWLWPLIQMFIWGSVFGGVSGFIMGLAAGYML